MFTTNLSTVQKQGLPVCAPLAGVLGGPVQEQSKQDITELVANISSTELSQMGFFFFLSLILFLFRDDHVYSFKFSLQKEFLFDYEGYNLEDF